MNVIKNARRADIYFHPNGKIDITKRVVNALHLQPGDSLDIDYDGIEYYLYVKQRLAPDGYKAVVRRVNKSHGYLRCWCKDLTSAICNETKGEAHLLCGEIKMINNAPAIAILTRLNLYKR